MAQRYHVFIDESEFKAEKLTSIGALLVPVEKLAAVERDVQKLRIVIGRTMRRKKYKYVAYYGTESELKKQRCRAEALRLRSGGLPEIHAKEMWQSQGAYFCERTPEALERRNELASRVTRIIEKHELLWMSRSFQGKHRDFNKVTLLGKDSPLHPFITQDISLEKIEELENDIHFAITFEIFMVINSLDELGIEIASVTCDQGKKTEIFGKFAGFDRIRPLGFWKNFPNPIFENSQDSPGIQLADFATYFLAKTMYFDNTKFDTPEWKIYQRLIKFHKNFETSVGSADLAKSVRPERRYRKDMLAMQVEAALLHCGGNAQTIPQRESAVSQIVAAIFSQLD